MSEAVKIVIVVEGGVIQSIMTAGVAVDCIVIDRDIDGCEKGELTDLGDDGYARVYREDVFDDPASRKTATILHDETP